MHFLDYVDDRCNPLKGSMIAALRTVDFESVAKFESLSFQDLIEFGNYAEWISLRRHADVNVQITQCGRIVRFIRQAAAMAPMFDLRNDYAVLKLVAVARFERHSPGFKRIDDPRRGYDCILFGLALRVWGVQRTTKETA